LKQINNPNKPMKSSPNLRILFIASEADPFVKVGGLGDVASSLPLAIKSLPERDIDIRLVIPFHGAINRGDYVIRPITKFEIPHIDGPISAEVYETSYKELPVYLISGPPFPPDALVYSDDLGFDAHKYVFFSMACLQLVKELNWKPDILHANDWHTAAAIYALTLNQDSDPFFQDTSTIIEVHNLPYLGIGSGQALSAYGLPPAIGSNLPKWAQHMALPLGLLSADHIVTVSPTYAREILTPEFGSGLDSFLQLRENSITGILNGIDLQLWDPSLDLQIKAKYDWSHLDNRVTNKLALQAEFGWQPEQETPILAMVGRMDYQKGVDLVIEALPKIIKKYTNSNQHIGIIILGTGSSDIENNALQLQASYPQHVRVITRFDANLSRRIFSGADILLIPSRYEPCGLAQMIAIRYGCVPIARATGGLQDSINDYKTNTQATGFLFSEATSSALSKRILDSLKIFKKPDLWRGIQLNGMKKDLSWTRSGQEYLKLYDHLI
jgi:starch synthase